jgi:hypothetical protein
MSAFNAGTIRGSLDLDTTSFNKGFQEAHTHAQEGGSKIREALESIAEVVSEALGPAVAQLTQQFQSLAAGFSEGPIIGSLNAIAIAAGAVREAVVDIGHEYQQMGLEAMKAGTTVEFMDRLASVAQTVNVPVEQVGMGFKILEQRAQEAAEGGKEATEAFNRVGISSTQLADLMKDPQKLFEAVQGSIGGMTDASERQLAASTLMGRGGAAMIPILAMQKQAFDELAERLESLGGGMNNHTTAMGNSFAVLQVEISKSMQGISKAVADPILDYLTKHMEGIQNALQSAVSTIISAINKMVSGFEAAAPDIIAALEGIAVAMGIVAALAFPAILSAITTAVIAAGGALLGLAAAAASPIVVIAALGAGIAILANHSAVVRGDLQALAQILEAVVIVAFDKLKEVFHNITADTGVLHMAFDGLSGTPLAPAVRMLVDLFKELGEMFRWVQDQASALIDKLMQAAGMAPGLIKTGTTTGMTSEQAAKELGVTLKKKDESAPHAGDSSGSPHSSDSAAVTAAAEPLAKAVEKHVTERAAETSAQPFAQDAEASKKYNALRQQGVTDTQAVAGIARDKTISSPPASRNPQPSAGSVGDGMKHAAHGPGYGVERGELTDARPDENGMYHISSASGHGMGGTVDKETFDRMNQKNVEAQRTGKAADGNATARAAGQSKSSLDGWHRDSGADSIAQWKARGGGGGGTDSIAQRGATTGGRGAEGASSASGSGDGRMGNDAMRSSFTQLSHSLDALSSKINSGASASGGGAKTNAAPVTNNYNITVQASVDPRQTANQLAQKILPHLAKVQANHDQAAAGQMQANMVASSMGGGD